MKRKLLLVLGVASIAAIGLAACGGDPASSQSTQPSSSTKETIYVEDITLASDALTVNMNETVKIEATVSPTNVTTRGVTYTSENPEIATVSSSGVVTGVKAGKTNIVVESKGTKSDGSKVSKKVAITVNEVFLTELNVRNASVRLQVNGSEQIEATILPADASNKNLIYSVEDASIATVSAGGLIKGVKPGSTTVHVKTEGKNAAGAQLEKTIAVEVVSTALAELKIAQPTINFNLTDESPTQTAKIEYEVLPSNADEKGVTFESDNPDVASVDETGLVTAKAVGEATITVTTVGVNAAGQHLSGTVTVTVTSKQLVVEFRNADGTLLKGYAADEIEVGETPDFDPEITNLPGKASDEENIYIFRGFDKEIKAYDGNKAIYNAVYEATDSTPRMVTLTLQGESDVIFTVTGESKGVDTESIKNRAWIAFQQYQGSWGTTYSDPQAPVINADGSWVMQMKIDPAVYGNGNTYMGKYVWNKDRASNPVDLKILHRENRLRYRHDGTTGVVREDNQINDEWDGILPEDYVETGNWGGGTSTNLDQEARQAFADSVPAPTWVGLGVSYEPAMIEAGGLTWQLFTDDSVWFLPSIRTVEKAAATAITITSDDQGAYYTVSGAMITEDAMSEADLMKASIDFEHNVDVDGGSGFVGATGKSGPGLTPAKVAIEGLNFTLYFRVDNVEGIRENDINGYYPHFALKDVSESGERADFKSSVKRTSGDSVEFGGYVYKIVSAGGNGAGYWGNPGLQIEKLV